MPTKVFSTAVDLYKLRQAFENRVNGEYREKEQLRSDKCVAREVLTQTSLFMLSHNIQSFLFLIYFYLLRSL